MRRVFLGLVAVGLGCAAEPVEAVDAAADAALADAPADTVVLLDTSADSRPSDAPTSDASVDAAPDTPKDGGSACAKEPVRSGGLTQYDKTALGNCGVPWPSDDLFAAMATADYSVPSPGAPCGKCARVTGPTGLEVVVRVVDQCPIATNPKCVAGHIDLSRAAYAAIVPKTYPYGGEVPNDKPIPWRYVPCPVSGPIVLHFKDGTNPYWIAVQVRNARHGIAKIRYRSGGGWVDATPRTDALPYFVIAGFGKSSIDLQTVDEHGHMLEDLAVPVAADTDVSGKAQFPACP